MKGTVKLLSIMLLLTIMFVQLETTADAKVYVKVGGDNGWGLKLGNWAQGSNLNAGDVLVFVYDPDVYNVVVVNSEENYNNCITPPGAQVHDTGEDPIPLSKGMNYFICNLPAMCTAGVRMAINGA